MFYSTLFIAAAALCGLASAQNYSTSGNLTVVPDSVPYDLRQSWCRGQTGNCPLVCGGQAYPNTCDADTLTYDCVCTDGSHPNISSYDAMLPSYICGQWKTDCVAAHPNDLTGQTACLSVVCGMKNASAVPQNGPGGSHSSSAAAASSSSSPTKTAAGGKKTGTAPASSATKTGAAVALSLGKSYGTGVLATALLAIFGLTL